MFTNLKEVFESKTFWTSLLSTIAAAAAVFHYDVPVGTIMAVLTPIMIMIGAQGWSDVTKMKLRLQHDHELKMLTIQMSRTVPALVASDAPKNAQGGFSRLSVMLIVATLGTTTMVGVVATQSSCGSTPPPIVTDVVDCVKAEGIVISNNLSLTQVISVVWGAVASIASGGLDAALQLLASVATTYGPDLVACIIDEYPSNGGGSGSGSGSAAPPAQLATMQLRLTPLDPAVKQKLLQQFAPGKKLSHGKAK